MNQFYVPAIPRGYEAANGKLAHTSPLVKHPHFEREEQAQGWLNGNPGQSIFQGGQQKLQPIKYGPNGDTLMWPKVTELYRVEIEREDKLLEIQQEKNRTQHSGIGESRNITLDPTTVLSRTTTIYPDALHEKSWTVIDEPRLGEHIQDEHIREQMLQRGADLQRLYCILERSGEKEREELDLSNPEHADIMRKLCVRHEKEKLQGSLEERTMQTVLRQLGENIGVRTALELSKSQIEAEFNARLEAQPPETPPAERVAVAMEGTLQKFGAQVPTRDAGTFAEVAAKVQGTINNLAEEIKSERISEFELNSLPDELRPAWMKVPENDKEKFIETFYRHRQERAELDAAADKAAFAATTTAMSRAAAQIGDAAGVEAYEDVSAELDEIEHGDDEPIHEE